jgi:predicted PurR-regulated permease PerM
VIDVVFVVVLSIYWTIDREYFERLWLTLLPLPHRVSARKLWRMLEAELGAYARSEITQSLLAGIVLGVAFYLLGLNYPILLAVVDALSWLIPWLGAIIALIVLAVAELPVLVLGWPSSLFSVATAALFTVVVFGILESVVEPRMFNRQRYNSLFIVVAVMAVAQTLGILGLLLGPMVAVATQAAVEHAERERLTTRRPVTDLAALDVRVADLRASADPNNEFPQEWISIVDRLAALIAQARETLNEVPE